MSHAPWAPGETGLSTDMPDLYGHRARLYHLIIRHGPPRQANIAPGRCHKRFRHFRYAGRLGSSSFKL